MTLDELKEIEDLLRDNNLDSLWSREEVRPAMQKLLAELRKLQEREAAFREALKYYAKAFHEPFKDAHTLHASGFIAREVLAKYPKEKEKK